ncbi:MAG: tyrosine-type recombinase/integrase [Anaerolineae bacterium]|nr:tyrosine-type recombinase/integrase [Anaerolineae bacterium]
MAKQLPLLEEIKLTARTPLAEAIEAFKVYMEKEGFTLNTRKSFLWDLSLLTRYLGDDRPVGSIGTLDLKGFLDYLLYKRGVPCKPKSYARRLTTLKVFFRWLRKIGAIPSDPAAPIPHQPARPPLPDFLTDQEIEALLGAANRLASGAKPDYRPLFLLLLLLSTGIKKSECLNLRAVDFDLSDPERPGVLIRYSNPKMQYKERKLALPPEIVPVFKAYLEQYRPREKLFECTGRNLEYVLHELAQVADLSRSVTFEMLRWTRALKDFKAGMDPEHLRRKLGLSRIRWVEFRDTLNKLATLL